MRVKLHELQEGCILSTDIFSRTNRPIFSRKTVLTASLIEVLKAFMIYEVEVEKTLINGARFIPSTYESDELEEKEENSQLSFTDLFLQSVSQYKKEFTSWQSGLPIDMTKIRALLLPLLEKVENNPSEVFNLHRFSTTDTYPFQHPVAVGLISGYIGKKLDLEKGEWIQLALAGCLADCGMAKINPRVLHKKTALTIREYEDVKNHPIHSYKMVQNTPVLRKDAKIAILQHHERLDGSGYPLKSRKVHQYARIIAIADTFHAMTSERLYRNKQSPFKALEMILEDSFGKFDINIVTSICSTIINFTPGDRIKLSNGQIAEVLFVDRKAPTRPLIKILSTDEIIQLERNRQLYIDEILS
ncbi:HD-GYP domain-containing protein [Bacillota bacterium Lsc_1132]